MGKISRVILNILRNFNEISVKLTECLDFDCEGTTWESWTRSRDLKVASCPSTKSSKRTWTLSRPTVLSWSISLELPSTTCTRNSETLLSTEQSLNSVITPKILQFLDYILIKIWFWIHKSLINLKISFHFHRLGDGW